MYDNPFSLTLNLHIPGRSKNRIYNKATKPDSKIPVTHTLRIIRVYETDGLGNRPSTSEVSTEIYSK